MDGPEFEALLGEFLAEAEQRTARVEQLLLDLPRRPSGERQPLLRQTRRELHTLKGNAGMMGFEALQLAAHELEDLTEAVDPEHPQIEPLLEGVDRLRTETGSLGRRRGERGDRPAPGDTGVRISYQRLDALVEHLGAQLLARHRMSESLATAAESGAPAMESCAAAWLELDRMLEHLQQSLLELRMVPVKTLFGRLRRLIHDEARRGGKEVRLETRGGNTPVDRALTDAASEVLGHLVRNAVVHGLETPDGRRRAGKPPVGMVRVEAAVRSESVQIDVLDDGAGIDRRALRRAAAESGIEISEADDLQALMFRSGLSTRRAADLSAGRGVGMDVVLEAVKRAGGGIEVASREGVGTRFRLRLPTSVSIAKALLLAADGREYALPVSAVLDTLVLPPAAGPVLTWRGRQLPLLDLGLAFGSRSGRRRRGFVVAVDAGGQLLGLVVEATRGPLEIMVRDLDDLLRDLPGVSGSSVLGDGSVVMILDPLALAALRPGIGEAA